MKKTLYFIMVLFSIQIILNAQVINQAPMQITGDQEVIKKPYPIPGSHLLREREKMVTEYHKQHPELQNKSLAKPGGWGFAVGNTHTWWADNLNENNIGDLQYEVPATCRAVGVNCYVFVADDVWNTEVDQDAVDAVVEAFDNSTPADAPYNTGIFNVDTEVFGDPPDVDSDEKIIILILDIKDGWDGSGGYVAGYFYSLNEKPDSGVDGTRSNEAEIFYMDCNPADLENGLTDVLSTTAHEFQHMIHWFWDDDELTFVNEGCSMIAEYICGYALRSNNLYAQDPNVNFLTWGQTDDVLDDYSRAAHWTLYMLEQFGVEIMRDFVENQYGSWNSFAPTFTKYATGTQGTDFRSVMKDLLIANYLNDTTIDGRWGFMYAPRAAIVPTFSHIGSLIATNTGTVGNLGANYITFSGGEGLSIDFTNVAGTLRFYAVKTGTGGTVVEDITITNNAGTYTPDGYGTTYDTVTIIVFNVDDKGDGESYTYTSTGAGEAVSMELAYEDGVSDGAFGFSEGDSIAVYFTGISGAKLDSVKIFFRGTGKITMSLAKVGTSFFHGQKLMEPKQLTVLNNTIWNKVNLTSSDIDASDDFVVSFVVGSDSLNPTIAVRGMPDTGEYHSRTYTDNDGTGQKWWVFHDGVDPPDRKYWNYLIRAYVSIGDVTVAIDQTGIVSIPEDFSLSANYPNPFNPSTTFDFATPKDGLVKFTVYDLLGRVIYNEQRNLFAGKYSFTWDGQNNLDQQVVSGVYFLQMEAEGFTQTHKMLMMK